MKTSETTWGDEDNMVTISICVTGEDDLPLLYEQIIATLKGLSYTDVVLEEYFGE